MAFDATTESIAHFIGIFELAQEEARLRADYDRIRAERAAAEEAEQLNLHMARIKAPHELEDVAPALDYLAPATAIISQAAAMALPSPVPFPETASRPIPAPPLETPAPTAAPAPAPPPSATADFHISPPSSLIAVTSQTAILSDDDTFGAAAGTGTGFAPVAQMTAVLVHLADAAEALSPVRLDLATTLANWFGALDTLRQALPEEVRAEHGPLQVTVATGAGATRDILVDGVRVDALPDWTEFRPAVFAEADVAGGKEILETHDFLQDFEEDDAPFEVEAGHAVVAGANSAINDAAFNSNWLDAPVIAVAGSVLRLDAISQVNMLVDHDAAPAGSGPAGSTATNVAEIVTTARDAAASESGMSADEAPDLGAGGTPDNWAVVRIEGDVTQVNWVDQYTFATDHDRAEVSFNGSNTYLGLGGNEILNDVAMWELGFAYDLIMVGGDMIDASIINQVNVLLDSDRVEIGGPAALEGAGTAGAAAGGSGLQNATPAAHGSATEGATAVGAETAGLPPKAAPAPPKPAALDPVDPAAPESASDAAPTGISTSDNLLWNQARIDTLGEDMSAPLDTAFSETLDRLADGAETIGADVAANPLFDGIELLRVLYVSGDFVTVDHVNQTNVFGDADQVRLARDQFLDDLHDQITATTGSNLMANFAEITRTGLNSDVMAGGDVYSDALIHQAELIETGPTEPGEIAALATEAVAFLVDDMIQAPSAGGIATMTDTLFAETAGQSDVMQTVLA